MSYDALCHSFLEGKSHPVPTAPILACLGKNRSIEDIDENGFGYIKLADGTYVGVGGLGGETTDHVSFSIRVVGEELFRLIFDLVHAGPFAFMDAELNFVVLPGEDYRHHLDPGVEPLEPAFRIAESVDDIRIAMSSAFEEWREYRDRVIGD